MGKAKYVEDNNELNEERIYYKEQKNKKTIIYAPEEPYDTFDTIKEIRKKQIINDAENSKNESAIEKPKKYEDKILFCKVCGKEFTFSKSDQIEYDARGGFYPNRCPKCERRKYLPTWIKI